MITGLRTESFRSAHSAHEGYGVRQRALIWGYAGPQGSTAKILDEYYVQLEQYSEEFPEQKSFKRRFLKTLDLVEALLPDIRKTRWRNRTDFYSLFVVLASSLRAGYFSVLGSQL